MNACPHCASLLRAGAKFCTSCGESVGVEEPEAAAPPAAPAAVSWAAAIEPSANPPEAARPPALPGTSAPDPAPSPPPESKPPVVPRASAGAGPSTAVDLPANPLPAAVDSSAAPAPPAAPRSSAPAPPSPPPPDPPRAFVTYAPLPLAKPPRDDSSADAAPPPTPPASAPPARAAAPPAPPAAALTPGTPLGPSAAPVPEPRTPAPPPAPKVAAPPGEGWSRGRLIAVAATLVLLVGSVVAALVLSGGSDKAKPAAAATAARGTPEPTASPPQKQRPAPDAELRSQVQTLDDVMKTSEKGRALAVRGETKAAIANRSQVLKDLQRLSASATDAHLKAGLRSFTAAIRESLRQNRECAANCSTSELDKVNRLKEQAMAELNPLLRKYAKTTYRSRDV